MSIHMPIHCVYKPLKMTSYQCVEKFRRDMGLSSGIKLGYAGRLDPMAEGLFLILEGEDNKRQDIFFTLDKEYEVEIILGIQTDSFDILGLPVSAPLADIFLLNESLLNSNLQHFVGIIDQKVPPYAAVRVDGKPLFWWAKQGRLNEIILPRYKRAIYSIDLLNKDRVGRDLLHDQIVSSVEGVDGHFRQKELVSAWRQYFKDCRANEFMSIRLRIACSSGTFIRQLVDDLGVRLGCGAMVYQLLRTRVGEFTLGQIN